MAYFDITIKCLCKGNFEDINNMKKRLKAIFQNSSVLDSGDALKELFGDELNEIEGRRNISADRYDDPIPPDVYDEKDRNYTFGGLKLKFEKADVENLEFSGNLEEYKSTEEENPNMPYPKKFDLEVQEFFNTLRRVFPRIKFLFHFWCYGMGKYSGKILTYEEILTFSYDNDDNPAGYNGFVIDIGHSHYNCWDEKTCGKENLKAWQKYIAADRATWFLDNKTSESESEWVEALEKEREAHAYFDIITSKNDPKNKNTDNISITSENDAIVTVLKNPGKYIELPHKYRTREVCLQAAEKLGAVCSFIPEELQSEEFYIELIKANKNGDRKAFRFTPKKYLTEKVCLKSPIDCFSGIWIPLSSKTPQVCRKMMIKDNTCLPLIPKKLRTEEMCSIALNNDWYIDDILQYVPEQYRTYEFCLKAIKKTCMEQLKYVPPEHRTEELCLEAVKRSHYCNETLKYVPEELHTPKMIEAAIKSGISEKTKIEEIGKLFNKTHEKISEAETKALEELEKFRKEK